MKSFEAWVAANSCECLGPENFHRQEEFQSAQKIRKKGQTSPTGVHRSYTSPIHRKDVLLVFVLKLMDTSSRLSESELDGIHPEGIPQIPFRYRDGRMSKPVTEPD